MHIIYDSDSFLVMENDPAEGDGALIKQARQGFEIISKQAERSLYLDGPLAKVFSDQIKAWQQAAPQQEDVENVLISYSQLAQNPLRQH